MHVKDANECIGFWSSFKIGIKENSKGKWIIREYEWECGCNAFCTFGLEDDLWFVPCAEHGESGCAFDSDGILSNVKLAAIKKLKDQISNE